MKPGLRLLAVALISAGIVGATLDANADSVAINAPTTWNVTWAKDLNATGSLTAQGTFNVTSINDTTASLTVHVTNTTDPSLNTIVSSFGFNTTPSVDAQFVSGTVFRDVLNDVTFPGFQTIEVCVITSQNCSSSTHNLGLASNATGSVTMTLSGDFTGDPRLTLSTFALQFAGDQGSFQVEGQVSPVPIPGTFMLFGAGLIGFVVWQMRSHAAPSPHFSYSQVF